MNQAEGATSATSDDDRRDMHPDRNCYTLPDGSCVSTSACMHSVYVYTVWCVDDVQARVYAYHRSLSDKSAREVAELISGVVTREEVIGDFRKREAR